MRQANDPVKGGEKSVVIVSGGPGTGKSVVAIQLLCDLINKGFSANYVTKKDLTASVNRIMDYIDSKVGNRGEKKK